MVWDVSGGRLVGGEGGQGRGVHEIHKGRGTDGRGDREEADTPN